MSHGLLEGPQIICMCFVNVREVTDLSSFVSIYTLIAGDIHDVCEEKKMLRMGSFI
jgi:hypothetical protein